MSLELSLARINSTGNEESHGRERFPGFVPRAGGEAFLVRQRRALCIRPPAAPAPAAARGGRRRLTAREREILVWIATGKSDWETGEILTLSRRTVAKHSQTILQKLAAANRTQAVAIALRESIIAP
ncbi:MAG TPA: helix-turn-helix domain-containing protein [Xanthobacteraceae bacterium]|nr:helix-turn-helix domain-containing protein [Xanthobacteraceae bacterium]